MNKLNFSIKFLLVLIAVSAIGANYFRPHDLDANLEFVKFDATTNTVELELENLVSNPISFDGYSIDSPLYGIQFRDNAKSKPQDYPMGWCGTGLEPQSLRRGATTTFKIPCPLEHKSKQLRIIVPVSAKDKEAQQVACQWFDYK